MRYDLCYAPVYLIFQMPRLDRPHLLMRARNRMKFETWLRLMNAYILSLTMKFLYDIHMQLESR